MDRGEKMTKKDVLSIAFKILGVVALMYTIVLIPHLLFSIGLVFAPTSAGIQSYMRLWNFIYTMVHPIVVFVMGYILLRWSDDITNKITKDDKPLFIKVTTDWDKRVFVLALKIIGVIWLIMGIPELIKSIGELTMRWHIYHLDIFHATGVTISGVISLLLGFYLITNGRYLIKLAFGEQVVTTLKKRKKQKLCKHCGKKLDIDATKCIYCGKDLSAEDTMPL
jgi:ribosomal protein L40E